MCYHFLPWGKYLFAEKGTYSLVDSSVTTETWEFKKNKKNVLIHYFLDSLYQPTCFLRGVAWWTGYQVLTWDMVPVLSLEANPDSSSLSSASATQTVHFKCTLSLWIICLRLHMSSAKQSMSPVGFGRLDKGRGEVLWDGTGIDHKKVPRWMLYSVLPVLWLALLCLSCGCELGWWKDIQKFN